MKRTLVTGGSGMLGYELKKLYPEFTFPSKEELNLVSVESVRRYLHENKFDVAIHLAAKVGGVDDNTKHVADFFSTNMSINRNFLEGCQIAGVKKVVSVLSTCVYPDREYVKYPLTEEQLHLGPPHPSNFGYAYAKRMLDVQSRALRQQYGCNFVTVVPNNLYGFNDNYDLESGHVIPSLIRRFFEAKIRGESKVFCWGSGTPEREFTFAADAAKIIVWVAEHYDESEPINIGNTNSVTIKQLAEMISKEIGFEGEIVWDPTQPDGQLRKPSSNKKLLDMGWKDDYTNFQQSLSDTIKWFMLQYPNVRGIK